MRVGIDSVDIARIEKSLEINGFFEKVYSPAEQEFLSKKKNPVPSCAANFAAKEAFGKALGTGVSGFGLSEVSVLRDEKGCPYIELSGNAAKCGKGYGFTVSITHTDDVATAIVIAYDKDL